MICPFLNLIFRRPGSYSFHSECSATRGIVVLKSEEADEYCSTEDHQQCPLYLSQMSRLNHRSPSTGKGLRRKPDPFYQESPA